MGAAAFQPSGFARLWEAKTVPMTSATVDMILMKISRQGPTVSLSGSPTVSPTTAGDETHGDEQKREADEALKKLLGHAGAIGEGFG